MRIIRNNKISAFDVEGQEQYIVPVGSCVLSMRESQRSSIVELLKDSGRVIQDGISAGGVMMHLGLDLDRTTIRKLVARKVFGIRKARIIPLRLSRCEIASLTEGLFAESSRGMPGRLAAMIVQCSFVKT